MVHENSTRHRQSEQTQRYEWYNSRVSTGGDVEVVLSSLLLYIFADSHIFPLSVAAASRQPPLLPHPAAEIPYPIRQAMHRHRYRYPLSDTLGGPLLCWPLLCMRRIRSHQRRRCCLSKWDTANISLPIMPDLFIPHLYFCFPCRTAYLLLSLSSVALIMPHLFCCTHCLNSLPSIF